MHNNYLVTWAWLIQLEGYMAQDIVISTQQELQTIFIITYNGYWERRQET